MPRLRSLLTAALLAAGAAVGTAAAAAAQQGPPGAPGGRMGQMMSAERYTEQLLKDVTLTDEQRTRVAALNAAQDSAQARQREAMRAARQAGERPGPAAMQGMRDRLAAHRDAVRALLTAEQQVIFDRNVAAMPQGRGPGAAGGRPPRG